MGAFGPVDPDEHLLDELMAAAREFDQQVQALLLRTPNKRVQMMFQFGEVPGVLMTSAEPLFPGSVAGDEPATGPNVDEAPLA